jgi:hypothetical protein
MTAVDVWRKRLDESGSMVSRLRIHLRFRASRPPVLSTTEAVEACRHVDRDVRIRVCHRERRRVRRLGVTVGVVERHSVQRDHRISRAARRAGR